MISSVDSLIESWILNSGASFHHSFPLKELFHSFKGGKLEKVYLADDESLDIIRKVEDMIKTSSGILWKLQDVRFIPKFKKSLI